MNNLRTSLSAQDVFNKKHIHLIGIGGSGMYPLAQILHSKGIYITGSDNNETETLDAVRKMGVKVFLGHRPENIESADLIVPSAAIADSNPELTAAKQSGIQLMPRSELLGIITEMHDNTVCVAGTHGKTTASGMLTQILVSAGIDLSAVIGGKLECIGGSGIAGKSGVMVCEACEFNDTFLSLYPDISVILNIDADHLDYFGTLENIIESFRKFCGMTTKTLIYNGDDPNTLKAAGEFRKNKITFGMGKDNTYSAGNIIQNGRNTSYTLIYAGKKLWDITLSVAGMHNVLNSLAAIAAASQILSGDAAPPQSFFEKEETKRILTDGLKTFTGAVRRFEFIGTVNGCDIFDDYAHHPAEIEATLTTAKNMGYNRVWAVFQPFTYSRTSILLDGFADVLQLADITVLTDIMGSRETNTYNIYTEDLAKKIPDCVYFKQDKQIPESDETKTKNFNEVQKYLLEHIQPGDTVITMGCGDVYKIAKQMIQQ
ncbi:MAG: UDP-N-acetylmuramate--L-alanine ligase [Oscillospiraceae bacterium]|jgi:UDP-N-acetylmuramate--alanine ligase|nr:UDP-N-acetylmuramate--L-alanine ligase [Oscillospiraceae bacterium]